MKRSFASWTYKGCLIDRETLGSPPVSVTHGSVNSHNLQFWKITLPDGAWLRCGTKADCRRYINENINVHGPKVLAPDPLAHTAPQQGSHKVKKFRVLSVHPARNGVGWEYALISPEGEVWVIEMPPDAKPWDLGQTIQGGEGLDATVIFQTLGAVNCKQIVLKHPEDEIRRVWGVATPAGCNEEKQPEKVAFIGHAPREAEDVEVQHSETPLEMKPDVEFKAHHFVATNSASAGQKAVFATQFLRLVQGGFQARHFTKSFYRRLCLCFGFYDLGQVPLAAEDFFKLWCVSSDKRVEFLRQIAEYSPIGDPESSWSDVEKALRAWVIQRALARYVSSAEKAETLRERQTLRTLLRKHGIPEDFKLP